MGGANALGAERNPSALYFPPQVKAAAFLPELGEGFFVVAANPFAIPIVNASGHAAWTSDNFDLARNGGLFFDFDLNRLDLQIKIGDISLTYFVNERFEMRFRDLVVRVAGEDINLDSFLFSSRNPAILSPDQISLVAGTCEIIPLSRSSDHAPVAFRDFSIDPLVSFQPAGSFYKSTVFVVEVDLFYPENLVLGLLLQPSFRPVDNFPALLLDQRSASPGAIYVGVPEASSEVMCGSGLLIAALVTINRLRAKRTN
jgi:hypothetical protein